MVDRPAPPPLVDPSDLGSTPWKTALVTGKQRMSDGTERVMLVILRDDTLQVVSFISPEQAETLAQSLLQTVMQIQTGLVVPPSNSLISG